MLLLGLLLIRALILFHEMSATCCLHFVRILLNDLIYVCLHTRSYVVCRSCDGLLYCSVP